jgi:outer membrane protein assembly factor BamD (BamD/ComL family)
LTREVKALELAHRALAEHDAPLALDLLDRYRVQFPGGSLSSEATVLRAQALLQNGDRAGAQALVDGYVSAHPDSPYARRLKDIVRGQ